MSLYREVGRGKTARLALGMALALLAGVGIGFGVGRATQPNPDLEEVVATLQGDAAEIRNALELVTIEYGEAVDDGEVTAQTEFDAAVADTQRAQDTFARIRDDLASLGPDETDALGRALDDLSAAVGAKSPPPEVEQLVETAGTALDDALPPRQAS